MYAIIYDEAMGATGENGDRVNHCMAIEKKKLLGFSSEDKNPYRLAAATARDNIED